MTCEKCLGARPYGKKRIATNFCKSCIWDSIKYRCRQGQPFYVYALVDRGGKVIYIGATDKPRRRFAQHARRKKFWTMRVLKDFQTWEEAVLYEMGLIAKRHPTLNKRTVKTSDRMRKKTQTGAKKPLQRFGYTHSERQTKGGQNTYTSDQSTDRN